MTAISTEMGFLNSVSENIYQQVLSMLKHTATTLIEKLLPTQLMCCAQVTRNLNLTSLSFKIEPGKNAWSNKKKKCLFCFNLVAFASVPACTIVVRFALLLLTPMYVILRIRKDQFVPHTLHVRTVHIRKVHCIRSLFCVNKNPKRIPHNSVAVDDCLLRCHC